MNIGEVQDATALSARQIRDYEKLGLLSTIARTPSGYRQYSAAQVERLIFIKHAREVGFSLSQIKQLLTLQDDPNRSNTDVKAVTQTHIAELTEKIARLQAMKTTLQTWHDSCLGDGSPTCSILQGLATGCHHP